MDDAQMYAIDRSVVLDDATVAICPEKDGRERHHFIQAELEKIMLSRRLPAELNVDKPGRYRPSTIDHSDEGVIYPLVPT